MGSKKKTSADNLEEKSSTALATAYTPPDAQAGAEGGAAKTGKDSSKDVPKSALALAAEEML